MKNLAITLGIALLPAPTVAFPQQAAPDQGRNQSKPTSVFGIEFGVPLNLPQCVVLPSGALSRTRTCWQGGVRGDTPVWFSNEDRPGWLPKDPWGMFADLQISTSEGNVSAITIAGPIVKAFARSAISERFGQSTSRKLSGRDGTGVPYSSTHYQWRSQGITVILTCLDGEDSCSQLQFSLDAVIEREKKLDEERKQNELQRGKKL